MIPVGQLTLFDLATIANREHALALEAGVEMIWHWVASGEALIEAKGQLRHGEWLQWLEANFEASERTARRYMLVAANRTRVADLVEPSLRKALEAIAPEGAHVGHNSGDNEWYSPAGHVEAARRLMGAVDLDPASNADANEVIGAATFYSADDDGLGREWQGRVWMNPPYAQPLIGEFCRKLVASFGAGVTEACVLVNNATETAWFQTLAGAASAVCFPHGRVQFWHPDKESAAPLQGQAIVYLGPQVDRFRAEFAAFGWTVTR